MEICFERPRMWVRGGVPLDPTCFSDIMRYPDAVGCLVSSAIIDVGAIGIGIETRPLH